MIIHNIEQGSEAWFEARCGRVTGTRFKSLMMAETTQGYKDLVSNMVCEIITGRMEETYSNAAMEHGVETEPIARAAYEALFDVEVKTVGFVTPDEDHKYHEWIGVSPDGIIDDGLIEIKCPKMITHLGYIADDKLPSEYRHQVQGQLFVTGAAWCDFVSYVEGMKLFVVRVFPDKEMFKEFEERLDSVIKRVISKLESYKGYEAVDYSQTDIKKDKRLFD
jgi:putative phage-type endonuclease